MHTMPWNEAKLPKRWIGCAGQGSDRVMEVYAQYGVQQHRAAMMAATVQLTAPQEK